MEAQIINNIKFIDPGQIAELKATGELFYESWMLTNIQKLPYRPGIWIDVGAHVGNHTVFFSNHCQADEVWAYEPSPAAFEMLKENVKKNPGNTVRLFNCAVGEHKGTCQLITNKERPGQTKTRRKKGNTVMEVLGDIAAKVALIKIDVEGSELEVLKGAMPMIIRDMPEIFIETFDNLESIVDMLPKQYEFIGKFNNAPTYHFSSNR